MSRGVHFWLFALGGILLDQVSKLLAFRLLERVQTHEYVLVPGLLSLVTGRNVGGVFGILPGRGVVFSVLAVAATAVVMWFYLTSHPLQWRLHCALGIVVAGAVGNMIDRLRFGWVRDFIDLYVGERHWPAFNAADIFITIGAIYLAIVILFGKDPPSEDAVGEST